MSKHRPKATDDQTFEYCAFCTHLHRRGSTKHALLRTAGAVHRDELRALERAQREGHPLC